MTYITNVFVQKWQRRDRRQRQREAVYATDFFYDANERLFYSRSLPALAVKEDEFNARYYLATVEEEDRDTFDHAAAIKSLRYMNVDGRVFEPENEDAFVVSDGKTYINAKSVPVPAERASVKERIASARQARDGKE